MNCSTPQPAPVHPASFPGSSGSPPSDGRPQTIVLRPSAWLRGAVGLFVPLAAAAVFAALAPRIGGWQAVPAACAVLAGLALWAIRLDRAAPGTLKIGPDVLTVRDRRGTLLCQGRIAGCSQWSGWLLMLSLVADDGRSRPLLLAADALSADARRELAVLGRRGAHGGL
ncbi:hypothetical protein [Paraburkholderia flava]|uniref:hypothetical protein n=1 Tax=Paraburkholderia flava TaxID=2547393 RepID=UPI0030B8CA0B